MKIILYMIRKEFLQIFRNKQMLPVIFLLPIFQLLILAFATTFEIKNINIHIIDNDKSSTSRELVRNFEESNNFTIVNTSQSEKIAIEDVLRYKAKMILKIPEGFEKSIVNSMKPEVQFMVNAEDGSAAGVIQSYASLIVMNFNRQILTDFHLVTPQGGIQTINIAERYFYNPEINYKHYMVPGILVILITIIGLFLSGMNIVKEKEIGTIEQLNVTPIKKYQFIIGKLLPFWLIGLFELGFGLFIGKLVFNIPILGSLPLLFAMAGIYLIVVLGIGLFISTITNTQQQAMFIAWFFVVIFILMSGLFTPIDSMPRWAQVIVYFNPIAHFIEIMRRVLMKGAGFNEIFEQFQVLSVYAIAMITISVLRYRKVSK